MPLLKDRKFLGIAVFLILCTVFSLLVFPVISLYAADQQTLSVLTLIQASLGDLRSQVTSMRADIRNDRATMLQRTNDWSRKLSDLSTRVDNLDVSHVVSEDAVTVGRLTRLEDIITADKQSRDQAQIESQAERNAILSYIRSGFSVLIASICGFIATALTTWWHRHKQDKAMVKLGADVEVVRQDIDSRVTAATNASKLASDEQLEERTASARAEGKLEGQMEGRLEGKT